MKNFNLEKFVEDLSAKFIYYKVDDAKSINEQFKVFLSLFFSVVTLLRPRTKMLDARGQGKDQGHSLKCFQQKKVFKKVFQAISNL